MIIEKRLCTRARFYDFYKCCFFLKCLSPAQCIRLPTNDKHFYQRRCYFFSVLESLFFVFFHRCCEKCLSLLFVFSFARRRRGGGGAAQPRALFFFTDQRQRINTLFSRASKTRKFVFHCFHRCCEKRLRDIQTISHFFRKKNKETI